MNVRIYTSAVTFLILLFQIHAQEPDRRTATGDALSGVTKYVVIGYAYSDFAVTPQSDVKSNFTRIGFSPTMIWKLNDKLFFESQVEFFTDSGIVKTQVEYAKLSYIYNKYITIGMGKLLTPFGSYTERFEAPFIERLPNAPLGFRHVDDYPNIGPVGSEVGLDIRGGFQVGDSKMNYVVYVSNGGKLNDGSIEPKLAGAIEYENFFDNNSNKAFGGRIGFLPFSNSSLEIGGSYQYSKVGDVHTIYKNTAAHAYAVDIAYHHAINPLKSLINIKSQVNYLKVDHADYIDEADIPYTFNNESYISYFRISLRPGLVKNKFLKRTELLYRYNIAHLAEGAMWGGTSTRNDLGLSYWLSVRTGIRVAYEIMNPAEGPSYSYVLFRFVTGF